MRRPNPQSPICLRANELGRIVSAIPLAKRNRLRVERIWATRRKGTCCVRADCRTARNYRPIPDTGMRIGLGP